MNPFIFVIPLLLVSGAVVYGVFRALGRVWLEQSLRLALLERVERNPELLPALDHLYAVLREGRSASHASSRHDLALTGGILALFGLISLFAGECLRTGRLAVGIYLSGVVCIAIGMLLFLVGVLIRHLARRASATLHDV